MTTSDFHLSIDAGMNVEAWRVAAESLANLAAEPDGVEFRSVTLGGSAAIEAIPNEAVDSAAFQFVHGGYVMCSAQSHRKVVGHLAREAGMRGYGVDYRRPPEHPFPAAIDDIVHVHEALAERYGAGSVGMVGDSGGGSIVGASLVEMQQRGIELPGAVALLSPWMDMTLSGQSMVSNAAADLFVTRAGLADLAAIVAGGHSIEDPLLSPLFADLAGWPPMFIQVAELEVLLDDGVRFANAAESVGVEVALEIHRGMQHGFYFAAGNLEEADDALVLAGEFLAAKLLHRPEREGPRPTA